MRGNKPTFSQEMMSRWMCECKDTDPEGPSGWGISVDSSAVYKLDIIIWITPILIHADTS